MTQPQTVLFDFWKDNKQAGYFQLTMAQLSERFSLWLPKQNIRWLNGLNTERIIRFFITEKNGLCSVHDENQFEDMYVPLRDALTEYERQAGKKVQ